LYKSFTKQMTPEERAQWFREEGQKAYRRRASGLIEREALYVNAKFRCSGYTVKAGQRAPKQAEREWYHQGSLSGMSEWSA
jgi:hypothetical protein